MKKYSVVDKAQLLSLGFLSVAVVLVLSIALGGIADIAASGTAKKLPIYAVGREEQPQRISFTFDAAWGNEDTPILIDILGRYDIHATFFVVASWVDKYPESVKQLSDAGHEIMNHSTTHPHMSQLSREQIRREIVTCNEKIAAITGKTPTLFRAPYGEYCNQLIEVLDELNMHCIQWDVDSLDWKNPPSSEIAGRVCRKVRNGSIVLFHNAAVNTPDALPILIEQLIKEGYTFAPVSEAIYLKDYRIDHEGRQWCNTTAGTSGTTTTGKGGTATTKAGKSAKQGKSAK